jgi:hypothetical protein
MQWNTLREKLQRDLFDLAGSIGDLQQKGSQISRFLHNHRMMSKKRIDFQAAHERRAEMRLDL